MKIPEYKLKVKNEDFEVTEVPLFPSFSKKGDHTYIWLKKSGFSTFDAQDELRVFFKLKFEDINSEGLKDEDGVTSQIVSIKKFLKQSDLISFNKKHFKKRNYIYLESILGYGNVPVTEKKLHGNSFNLVIRNLKENEASNISEYCEENKFISFINYYDSQRFGMPEGPHNTHLIGKAIVEGNWKEAFTQFKISKNKGLSNIEIKIEEDEHYKKLFQSLNPKKLNFFVSSYDSYLWNQGLSLELERSCKGKSHTFEHIGDLFVPHGNVFVLTNIFSCQGNKLDMNLSISKKNNSRNALITTAVYVLGIESDELHKKRKKVKLTFFLPTGGYATMCVRQLIYKSIA